VRIFLCVADWDDHPKSLDAVGVKNRLFGFSNLWDEPFTKRNMLRILRGISRVKGNGEMLMVDSGVAVLNERYYCLGVMEKRGRVAFDQPWLENLVDKYELLLRAGVQAGIIDCAVEMDVDHFVGYKTVKEYRRRFEDTGVKLIPVWRPTLGREIFDELTENYDWIALSKGIGGRSPEPGVYSGADYDFMKKLMRIGVSRGVKIHFFAGLRRSFLFSVPLYSADSTSWSGFGRWAITLRFDSEMKWIRGGNASEGLVAYNDQGQIGVEDIPFDPLSSLHADTCGARAYVELEDYVTKYWAGKGVTFDA